MFIVNLMADMSLSTFIRAVNVSRRRREIQIFSTDVAVAPLEPPRRLTAMGIDVSPVHGRHCICGRCAPQDAAKN